MQSGQLIVTGNSEIAISLRGAPSKVVVRFEDECVITPCNPKTFDELQWEVLVEETDCDCDCDDDCDCCDDDCCCNQDDSTFELLIGWDVSGVREINWTVYY